MENPRETYRRLRSLAEKPGATDSERETAKVVMAKFSDKYGAEVDIPEEEEIIDRKVTYIGDREHLLAAHCASFTEVEILYFGKTVRGKFKPDGYTMIFRGYSSAVESAVALYEHHLERMRRLLQAVENGYRHGAMPLKNTTAKSGARPLTEEELAAYYAARNAGKSAQLQKHLTAGKNE